MLVVTVIERSQSLKFLIIFFFVCSICGPDNLSNTPRPPSQYKPMLLLSIILLNMFKTSIPTNSQVSAPSQQVKGTSKSGCPDFFSRGWLVWKSRAVMKEQYYQAPLPIYLLTFIVEHYIRVAQINMEKFNIDYSTRNIPIPSEREDIQLISKVEKFIKRMRSKAWNCKTW